MFRESQFKKEDWFSFYNEDTRKHESAKEITYYLFPRSDPKKSAKSIDRIAENKKLRIFAPDHFPVYFGMQFHDYRIDKREIKDILNSSYEQTEELRRYLSNLNTTEEIEVFTPVVGISDDSVECMISDNLLFITHEQCKIQSDDVCIDNT